MQLNKKKKGGKGDAGSLRKTARGLEGSARHTAAGETAIWLEKHTQANKAEATTGWNGTDGTDCTTSLSPRGQVGPTAGLCASTCATMFKSVNK